MDVVEALTQLGGVADAAAVRKLTSRRALRRAVAARQVLRPKRGRCALPVLDETQAAVRDLGGVRSHLSAALHHGWAVKTAPSIPMIKVDRRQRVGARQQVGVRLYWRCVSDEERSAGVTNPVQTVLDCARDLPFDEALAVADSALRSGMVDVDVLRTAADRSPRSGRTRALRVVAAADGRAANPFESVLRALALTVPGLDVEPQIELGAVGRGSHLASEHASVIGRADLVDVAAGIVIEAESWEFHGAKEAFERDVRRYTAMVRAGWRVVRFTWAEVMHDPEHVRAVLADVLAIVRRGSTHRIAH